MFKYNGTFMESGAEGLLGIAAKALRQKKTKSNKMMSVGNLAIDIEEISSGVVLTVEGPDDHVAAFMNVMAAQKGWQKLDLRAIALSRKHNISINAATEAYNDMVFTVDMLRALGWSEDKIAKEGRRALVKSVQDERLFNLSSRSTRRLRKRADRINRRKTNSLRLSNRVSTPRYSSNFHVSANSGRPSPLRLKHLTNTKPDQ